MRSKVPPDNTPKITLVSVLKRRRTNLTAYMKDLGISNYGALRESCKRMGVIPPSEEEFKRCQGDEVVSVPTEGIIVLPPPPVILESTGETLEPDLLTDLPSEDPTPRRSRRKTSPEEPA